LNRRRLKQGWITLGAELRRVENLLEVANTMPLDVPVSDGALAADFACA